MQELLVNHHAPAVTVGPVTVSARRARPRPGPARRRGLTGMIPGPAPAAVGGIPAGPTPAAQCRVPAPARGSPPRPAEGIGRITRKRRDSHESP